MDSLFASFLLLDEGTITAISVLLVICGGVLASGILDVKITLRRVSYLWFLALAGMALSISQSVWLFLGPAIEAGLFSILIIFGLGSLFLFGMALYYGSAARMRDISGSTSGAWMGFVPFINLYLIFKGKDGQLIATETRSPAERYVLDPILVIGALAVFGMSRAVDEGMMAAQPVETESSAKLRSLLAEAQTVEESFEREVSMTAPQLPLRIDNVTVVRKIESTGRLLTITYDLDQEVSTFRPDFKATLAQAQCAPDVLGTEIRKGGTVRMVYYAPSGRLIEAYDITAADCSS